MNTTTTTTAATITAHQLQQALQTRHSCKAFDATKKINDENMAALLDSLRLSASSINSQPWHFVVASSDQGKARIAQSTSGMTAYNEAKILNCSHVVVIATRKTLPTSLLDAVTQKEQQDGRIQDESTFAYMQNIRQIYVNLHNDMGDTKAWASQQGYIALGTLLLSAKLLGIDACPIEGFTADTLDAALNLPAQNLESRVLCALGYHSDDDFNAQLPKSRLTANEVFTFV